jgi:hypothetical protein
MVTESQQSAILATILALYRSREGRQLLRLNLQEFEGFGIKEQVVIDILESRIIQTVPVI